MKQHGLLNPDKADLDNDGQLSSYEKARGKAIERNLKGMGGLLDDERERYADGTPEENIFTLDSILFKNDKEKKVSVRSALEKSRPDFVYAYMQSGNKDFLFNKSYGDEGGIEYQSGEMPEEEAQKRFKILLSLFNDKDVLPEAFPSGTRGLRESKVEGGTPEEKEDKLTQESFMQMIANAATQQGLGPAEYKQQIGRRYAQEQLGEVSDDTEEHILQFARGDIGQEDFFKYFIARETKAHGGPHDEMDTQMSMLMIKPAMESDEEMEENYIDFIMDEALDDDEQDFLMNELRGNDRLSEVFDKVIEVASEFSGSGPVEGPGSGVSDSMPARLSDGEFVFTAKATEQIGESELMRLMKDAEAQADERQQAQNGGPIREEQVQMELEQPTETTQNIRVVKETVDPTAMVQEEEDLTGKEIRSQMMLDPYQRHVRS